MPIFIELLVLGDGAYKIKSLMLQLKIISIWF